MRTSDFTIYIAAQLTFFAVATAIVTLVLFPAHASAQYYTGYESNGYESNGYEQSYYDTPVPRIETPTRPRIGPDISLEAQVERSNRRLETINTIQTYELIYGDTYRR